jgi:hypothetical protein
MYLALGRPEEQERIRRSANIQHCHYLRLNSRACERLPEEGADHFGEQYVGKPCPNNPYHEHRDELLEVALTATPAIERAERLVEKLDWGLMSESEIESFDFDQARIARRHRRLRQDKDLAQRIALEVAKMFGGEGG